MTQINGEGRLSITGGKATPGNHRMGAKVAAPGQNRAPPLY